MPDWATFAAATVVLTLLILYFTRRSRRTLERIRVVDSRDDLAVAAGRDTDEGSGGAATGSAPTEKAPVSERIDEARPPVTSDEDPAHRSTDDGHATDAVDDRTEPNRAPLDRDEPVLTTTLLLVNAAASQALALVVLVALAWWTAVPASAFGLAEAHPVLGSAVIPAFGSAVVSVLDAPSIPAAIGLGAVAGVALYAGNESIARLATRVGIAVPDRLREAMAPGDAREWGLLLGIVLPVVALFEEALFRGALIGVFAVGLAVDPWLLAVASSVAFGLAHSAQGRIGIAVTGLLGLGLAGLFVVSGSLLLVIVAHYVVNASEFVVREGVGVESASADE